MFTIIGRLIFKFDMSAFFDPTTSIPEPKLGTMSNSFSYDNRVEY